MRRAGASLGLLARLARRGDAAAEALSCAPAGVQPVQAGLLPPLTAGGGGTATSGLHTSALGSFARSVSQPAINRRPPAELLPFQLLQAAGISRTAPASITSSPTRGGRPSFISRDREEDIAAARQRLQAYLQQQGGISQAQAAQLAGKLSAKLGSAADQLVPVPLRWFASRGMRPLEAAQLVERICRTNASYIRQWPKHQPAFEANWQLADSLLAAYQQQCRESKEQSLKGSQSMAAMLSSQPSRYLLLRVPDLASKLTALQQGQLGLSAAEVGQLIAAGATLTGTAETIISAVAWLVRFAGDREAAVSMARAAPTLLATLAATLDGKMAALQAAWGGVLQPEQLRQLVQQRAAVLQGSQQKYSATAAVLRSWFPQPSELHAVLRKAPVLLAASADVLQANQRWFTGPPLSLSHEQFLALFAARPKPFLGNLADPLTQHKLAFLAQVGGVPLERALSESQIDHIQRSTTALAGRYFLLTKHGVPVPRNEDGGTSLTYAREGLPHLLRRMRLHDSQGRLQADDDAALAYIQQWLDAWPETESGRRWAQPPRQDSKP